MEALPGYALPANSTRLHIHSGTSGKARPKMVAVFLFLLRLHLPMAKAGAHIHESRPGLSGNDHSELEHCSTGHTGHSQPRLKGQVL